MTQPVSHFPSGFGAGEDLPGRPQNSPNGLAADQLANTLGWLSLGLGLAGIAAPREVARLIGVRDDERSRDVLRTVGMREIVSGIGILTQPRPAGWVWSRVAGDMIDLALLSSALKSETADRNRVAAATAAVVGIAAVDLLCSQELTRQPGDAAQAASRQRIEHVKAITINRSPGEVYGFWRDLRNLPRFMNHLESVEVLDHNRSHWRARGPAGSSVEWDAEIVEDRPDEFIAWRSLPGAGVENSGWVQFTPAPGGRGTEVRVALQYRPPAGVIGATIARLFGEEPEQQVQDDLRTFKQVLETGEIVRSEGSIRGSHFPQHPAQPPSPEKLAA
jgi:uncharacterized membrane protein